MRPVRRNSSISDGAVVGSVIGAGCALVLLGLVIRTVLVYLAWNLGVANVIDSVEPISWLVAFGVSLAIGLVRSIFSRPVSVTTSK